MSTSLHHVLHCVDADGVELSGPLAGQVKMLVDENAALQVTQPCVSGVLNACECLYIVAPHATCSTCQHGLQWHALTLHV